jgi:hypothetical protein
MLSVGVADKSPLLFGRVSNFRVELQNLLWGSNALNVESSSKSAGTGSNHAKLGCRIMAHDEIVYLELTSLPKIWQFSISHAFAQVF